MADTESTSEPAQHVSIAVQEAALLPARTSVHSDERKQESADGTGTTSEAPKSSPTTSAAPAKKAGPNPLAIILLLLLSPIIILGFCLYVLVALPFLLCDTCGRHSSRHLTQPVAIESSKHSSDKYKPVEASTGHYFQSNISRTWIYYRSWYPASVVSRYADNPDALGTASDVKGVVFVIHGFGEHCSRPGYAALAKTLTDQGLAVFALDHQGHGKSTGDMCHVQHFQHFVDDVLQFMTLHNKYFAGAPRFLFGHSMGGLISLTTALQISSAPEKIGSYGSFHDTHAHDSNNICLDLHGLVLSAPATYVDPALAPPVLVFAAKILSFAAPKMALDGLDPVLISRSPDAVALYKSDPLIYKRGARARLGNELLAFCVSTTAALPKLTIPILLLHGTKDAIVPIKASETIYANVSSQDKIFQKFDGLYHEMFEDPESDQFFGAISTWFAKHTA